MEDIVQENSPDRVCPAHMPQPPRAVCPAGPYLSALLIQPRVRLDGRRQRSQAHELALRPAQHAQLPALALQVRAAHAQALGSLLRWCGVGRRREGIGVSENACVCGRSQPAGYKGEQGQD
mgnify:CR=1 FL=1